VAPICIIRSSILVQAYVQSAEAGPSTANPPDTKKPRRAPHGRSRLACRSDCIAAGEYATSTSGDGTLADYGCKRPQIPVGPYSTEPTLPLQASAPTAQFQLPLIAAASADCKRLQVSSQAASRKKLPSGFAKASR